MSSLKNNLLKILCSVLVCALTFALGFAFVNGSVTQANADETAVMEYSAIKAENSWLKSDKRIAFQIDKNNRPADGDYAINGGSITLERNGQKYSRTEGMTLTIYTSNDDCVAYMELWQFGNNLGEAYTRNVGDVYTIKGQFGNIKIKEIKIGVAHNDTLFIWGGVDESGLQTLTTMSAPELSWASGRWYFKTSELIFTNLTEGLHYISPKNVDNVVLIRAGVPYVAGYVGGNSFTGSDGLNFYTTDWWWGIDGLTEKTAKDGDVLIFGGAFTDGVNSGNIEKTVLKVISVENKEQYVVHNCSFTDVEGNKHYYEYTVADRESVLNEIRMLLHADDDYSSYSNNLPEELPEKNGMTYSETKLPVYNASASESVADWDTSYMAYFFNLDDNGAIGNWTSDYKPLTEDAVKVTRGETVYNAGNTSYGIINKRTDTYILKTWAFGAARPLQTGDIITIDGTFSNGTTTFRIAKVEFELYDNGTGVTQYSENDGLQHFMRLKSENEPMTMLEGASVRVADGASGIRFEAEVGSKIDENAKYYVMIVPYSYMEGISGDYYTELSAKYSTLAVMESVPYLNENEESGRKANTYYVRGSLVNLRYENLNRKFFGLAFKEVNGVRTYADFNDGENVRSIAQVSSRALNASAYAEQELSEKTKNVLESYVNKAVCQALGKTSEEAESASKIEFTLDRTNLNLAPGETYTLKCANLPDGADIEILNATDNGNIATIDGLTVTAGNVTGETYVKAYIGGQYRYILVNVQTTQAKIGVWAGSVWDLENESYLLTDERMTELADAGVNMIIGVWHNPDETTWTYKLFADSLDRADELGIKIYPKYEGDGSTVPSYYNHKAIGGFLIYDEPGTAKFSQLKSIRAAVEEKTGKPCFANLMPGVCSNETIGISDTKQKNAYLNDLYEKEYVKGYVDSVGGDILSYDYYAIKNDSDGNRTITWSYLRDFDIYSYNAKESGKELWYTMLSAGHDSVGGTKYVTPTENDMRWQAALAMAFGVKSLNHFIYTSDASDYTSMIDYNTGKKTQIFNDMATVNREIQAWSGTYASYEWQGISTVGDNSLFKAKEEPSSFFSSKVNLVKHAIAPVGCSVTANSGSAVVGNFKDSDGNFAYMITNADDPSNGKTAKLTVTFNENRTQVKIIRNGTESIIDVTGNKIELEVLSGEGIFVIPQ